ncbi:MAG: FAD binding domain-containing protein, partial [Pseudomonadota bacterium]
MQTKRTLLGDAFDYAAPPTIDEVLHLLAEHGEEARILAGGQSLGPLLSAKLARPTHIIDINRLVGADRPELSGNALIIPALTRHVSLEAGVVDGPLGALFAQMAKEVGPEDVRNRGTVCGALADANPAAEWCLAAITLGAEITLASAQRGVRNDSAAQFLRAPFVTSAAADELITGVTFPLLPSKMRAGFAKIAETPFTYGEALSIISFHIIDGALAQVRIGLGGLEPVPRRIKAAEVQLTGASPTEDAFCNAARVAADEIIPLDADR